MARQESLDSIVEPVLHQPPALSDSMRGLPYNLRREEDRVEVAGRPSAVVGHCDGRTSDKEEVGMCAASL
jgi:hypothetical protein